MATRNITFLYELMFVYETKSGKRKKVKEHFRSEYNEVLTRARYLQDAIILTAKQHGADILYVSPLTVYKLEFVI